MRRVPFCSASVLLAVLISTLASPTRAEERTSAYHGPRRQAVFGEVMANTDDALVGGSVAVLVATEPGLALGASFAMRPGRRWMRVPIGSHQFLQLHERRFAFALELSDQYSVVPPLGLYSKLGAGYAFADFEGTQRNPDEGWFALADAGFALSTIVGDWHRWSLRLGYRFADLRSEHRGWMHVALGTTF